MHAPSNTANAHRRSHLVVKLFVATAAVALTAGIALNDRRGPSDVRVSTPALATATGHSPLSEAASTSTSDLPEAAETGAADAKP